MSIWSFLDAPVFIVALGFGLLVTYMTVPPPRIVIKFPTPFNAGRIVYAGHPKTSGEEEQESGADPDIASGADECYKYRAVVVDCKDYPGKVKPQPMTLGAAVSIRGGVGSEGFRYR